jgi:hypothetical protein
MKLGTIAACLAVAAMAALFSFLADRYRVPADPRLEITREVDVGNRDKSEAVEVYLPVINLGAAPLEITNVRTGCSCVGVSRKEDPVGTRISKLVVPPRAQAEMRITLRARDQGSGMSERVAFATNDPTQSEVEIWIKGKVFGAVKFDPPSLDFGKVVPGAVARSVVKVLDGRRPDNRSALRLHHGDSACISVGGLENPTTEEGTGTSDNVASVYTVPVEMRFPKGSNEIKDHLVVTDDTGYQLCSLPVYANALRRVDLFPSEVLMPVPGAGRQDRFQKQCLCISESVGFGLATRTVPKELSVQIDNISENRKRVIIRRSEDAAGSSRFHGTVILAVSVKGEEDELLEVPVTILDDHAR